MAQDGDTITYTYSDGTSDAEDVSGLGEMVIEYIDGAGGADGANGSGGSGGKVENVTVDISSQDTVYIWVSSIITGRYEGGFNEFGGPSAGGSCEIAFVNTNQENSSDEPFIAGAGGGGGGAGEGTFGPSSGCGGARGGSGDDNGSGTPPPLGGDGGGTGYGNSGEGGGGAVASRSVIIDPGTTSVGGGSDGDGEVRITYKTGVTPPEPPSNLSAEVQ